MKISRLNIVLTIFVVNALVAITSNLEVLGDFHTGYWRALLIALALPFLLLRIKITKTTIVIGITLIYLIICLFTNTRLISNVSTFTGVIFSLLMYPLAYTYLYKEEHFQKLSKLIILLLFIFGVHFILAQIFQIGRLPYENYGGFFYTGGGNVQQTYILVYLLLFTPFITRFYSKNLSWFEITVIVLSIIPVFFIFRRGAVMALLAGVTVYAFMNFKKSRFFKIVTTSGLALVVLFPVYLNQMEPMFEQRTIDITDTDAIEQIGRTQEIITWVPYWIDQKGLTHTLFGSELYDYQALAGVNRPLHTDYAVYLIGAGVVGFILYFSILLFIVLDFKNHIRCSYNKILRKEMYSIMLALIAAYLIISYSGQYYVISSLSTVMFLFGVLNRYVLELHSDNDLIIGLKKDAS